MCSLFEERVFEFLSLPDLCGVDEALREPVETLVHEAFGVWLAVGQRVAVDVIY